MIEEDWDKTETSEGHLESSIAVGSELEGDPGKVEKEGRKQLALLKQGKRFKKVLRAPESKRQPLKELSCNSCVIHLQGKRKSEQMDCGKEEEGSRKQQGKRNKTESGNVGMEMVSEGMGSNPLRTPEEK